MMAFFLNLLDQKTVKSLYGELYTEYAEII